MQPQSTAGLTSKPNFSDPRIWKQLLRLVPGSKGAAKWDDRGISTEETARLRSSLYQQVVTAMQDEVWGIFVIEKRQNLPKERPAAFLGADAVDWLMEWVNFKQREQALFFLWKLARAGFLFPVEYGIIRDAPDCYCRFQTHLFWPGALPPPTEFDYAVYLCKLSRTNKPSMLSHELSSLETLQSNLRQRWAFVTQMAQVQVAAANDKTPVQKVVFESQERAYWFTLHPPPMHQQVEKAFQDAQKVLVDVEEIEPLRWGNTLGDILSTPSGYQLFADYLATEFSEENLAFWKACTDYRVNAPFSEEERQAALTEIFEKYISPGAPCEVNIPAMIREKTTVRYQMGPCDWRVLELAEDAVYSNMAKDSFNRFVRSDQYTQKVAHAEAMAWLAI